MAKELARLVLVTLVMLHGVAPSQASVPAAAAQHDCGHAQSADDAPAVAGAQGDQACCEAAGSQSCCGLACAVAPALAAMAPATRDARTAGRFFAAPAVLVGHLGAPPTRPPIR